jgi:predicted phosphodiesterase
MSEKFDLTKLRVSSDDAILEVIQAKAKMAALQRELSAVKRDRDDAYHEFRSIQSARTPIKFTAPKRAKAKDDFIRIIANDVHGSSMDRPAVEAFLTDLKRWSPDEIVLNGDIIECGGFLAKHHVLGYVAQTEYSYQDDISATNWFLDEVQKAAPNAAIHYIEGNHDERPEKWVVDQTMRHQRDSEFLRGLVSPSALLKLDERGIQFYRRSIKYVDGLPPGWIKLGKVFFTHELSGSKNAARDSVNQTAGNVVFGHTHREDTASLVLPGVGLVKAWNPGCLCLMQPLWRHSNPTNWSHGYGVQIVARSGEFLHLNIPIWQGRSLAGNLHGMLKP